MKLSRRAISLLLAMLMVFALLPTAAVSAAPAQTLELQYDDYFTFENAESVTVPEGTSAIEVDDTTIHAVGVTDADVTVTVDGTEYAVSVAKAKVNIVLVDGQSNAMGTIGDQLGYSPITPDKGNGYWWNGTALVDLKEKVDAQAENGKSVGFYPAIAAEWYALTGEKTVIVHDAKSGNAIQAWTTSEIDRISNKAKACINYIAADENYEISHAAYYWLQGESNSPRQLADTENMSRRHCNPDVYESYYMPLHEAYIEALETAGVEAMGGILAVRSMSTLDYSRYQNAICDYDGPRAAQQNMANQNADLIMASVLTNGWKEFDTDSYTFTAESGASVSVDHIADMFYRGNTGHYNQSGYDIMGLDAADNMYHAMVEDAQATDFDLYGNDGVTVYDNGDEILLSDISRAAYVWEVCNPEEADAAQVVVCPTPSYGKCDGAEMTLIDATGADVSGIIGNNGYILDATQITYPLTLAVTAAGVTKTYTVTDTGFTLPENNGNNYYWDFTDTSKMDGDTFAAQTSNYWKENTLTFSSTVDDSAITGLDISDAGYTGKVYPNDTRQCRMYLRMAKPVTLKEQGKWTVEFQMNPTKYGTILGVDQTSSYNRTLFYFPNIAPRSPSGASLPNSTYIVLGQGNMAGLNCLTMDVADLDIPNGVFYLTNDGTGALTMTFVKDGVVEKTETGKMDASLGDFVFQGVGGDFKGSNYGFVGTMQYMKIYEEYTQFDNTDVTVTPPVAGEEAQTAVSGDGYTGYITWSPALDNGAFGEHTSYKARIVLAADADYNFVSGISTFTVNGESVTPSSVTPDMAILNVTFPETGRITTPYDNFYWDFTTADVTGKVVASVADDTFASNPLTYQAESNPTVSSTNGWTNTGGAGAANRENFFRMSTPAILPKNAEWTIETEYKAGNFGTVLGTSSNSVSTWSIFHYPSYNAVFFSPASSVRPDQHYNVNIEGISFSTFKKLYVTNDGTGKLTMCVVDSGGTVLASAVGTQAADATMDGVGGRFAGSATNSFPLHGSMKYMKITREATIFDTIDVTVPAPIYGVEPVTEISGNGYTGTVTWSPAVDEAFAANTEYTATVSLTLDNAKFFGNGSFTVNGEAVAATAQDETSATLDPVAFEATGSTLQGYYWNFTNTSKKDGLTFKAETGPGWAPNTLTNNDSFDVSSTDGYTGSWYKRFTAQTPVVLKKDQEWTIEWQGRQSSSLVLSNGYGDSHEYVCYSNSSNNTPNMVLSPGGNMASYYLARMYNFDASIVNDINTIWYISNDGSGNITIAYKNGDTYQKTVAAGALTKDLSFDTVMGTYNSTSPMSYAGKMKYMKIYFTAAELPEFAARVVSSKTIDTRYYMTVNEAIAACPTQTYDDNAVTSLGATTVDLLKDAEGGFDIGVEADKFATQNIRLNLNGHTLTLGHPGVASGDEDDKGIRVLAHSKLVVNNGTLDVTAANVKRGMNVYGECTLNDVEFAVGGDMDYTVRNRGVLNLEGTTVIPNCGASPALIVEPYEYGSIYSEDPITFDVDATVVCDSANVTVGDVVVKLADVQHYATGEVNNGVPNLDISAGTFGTITEEDDDKTPKGNITGGTFDAKVPEDLCGDGYIPTKANAQGKYSVKQGAYVAQIGNVKYESINEAIAACPTQTYDDNAVTSLQPTTIDLLKDCAGGFDIGVEADKFATQNIRLNLNGHTLTLGHPGVASGDEDDKGIRVLAHSKLVVNNGTLDVTAANVKRGMNVYGECTLNDVEFAVSDDMDYTVRNRGKLTLLGSTVIPNSGDSPALIVEPYEYGSIYSTDPITFDVDAAVVCDSADVEVGDVLVELAEVKHYKTGEVNNGAPNLDISAGTFGTITEEDSFKTPEGNITGGIFDAPVPENLCAEGYIPCEADAEGKYTVKTGKFVAKIGDKKYESVTDALADVPSQPYHNTPANPTTIVLLDDVSTGFDIGLERQGYAAQNVVIDMNGYTMTLGHPPVGSSGTQTNGIRVLAFSKLAMSNGKISVDTNAVRVTIANYGDLTLTNVEVEAGNNTCWTINNAGDLTLNGTTSVADSSDCAIIHSPYLYPDDENINPKINVSSEDVVVGDIIVDLNETVHPSNGAVNSGVPEMNISAGTFGTISETGNAKTPAGNITGGTFDAKVPEDLCGDGYIPTDANPLTGKYSVKVGEYVAQIGNVKYECINDAVAACPTQTYDDNAVTSLQPTTIELLKDAEGGFDIGVEADKFATQNIILNLNGYTLTLGHPGVASGSEDDKGIRVLAHSKLVINNGTLDVTAANVTRGMNVYGECTLNDVEFIVPENGMEYTVRNRGVLNLEGETIIPNCGDSPALIVEPYEYGAIYSDPMTFDVDATVVCDSADVEVGDVLVKLAEVKHYKTGEVNNGVPNLDISAGTFGTITEEDSFKTPEGNITGGIYDAPVPENLCADGYIPCEANVEGKYTVKVGEYVAQIGDVKYESINDAVAACPTQTYDDNAVTSLQPTTIDLLKNAEGGFDIGVEADKFATQNIILNLNGYTLTLGHPGVASGSEDDKGIRVLAHSKLVVNNGTLDVTAANVKRGMNVYGECTLNDVEFAVSDDMDYTVRNRGKLTLQGSTVIPNSGDSPALIVEPYEYGSIYSEDLITFDVDATVVCDSADVEVGDVLVKLAEVKHYKTGEVNNGVPNLDISAGTFGTITEEDSFKTPEGNITGGIYDAPVPENLCAEGYIPCEADVEGKYTVKVGEYVAQIGDVKYESINDAVAACPTQTYDDNAVTSLQPTTIDLLKDCVGGFDVGVESSRYATQNIILNLNGYTLTLGQPGVASGNEDNKGIRVLAHSKLVINDGALDVTAENVTRGMNVYGECTLNDVEFIVPEDGMEYTVRNRGVLNLEGETIIPNCGDSPALIVEPYEYGAIYSDPMTFDVDAVVVCNSEDVVVGDIEVLLAAMEHHSTHEVNNGVPNLTISNGTFGTITEIGEAKTPAGNITGGIYDAPVPENLCADGYIPCEADVEGKYTVKEAEYVAQIGDVKYTSLAAAFEAAQTGDTVTVIKSHEFADSAVLKKSTDITLDLNGKDITYTGTDYALELNKAWTGSLSSLVVENGGSITATNGGVFNVKAYNTLTVNGGTYNSELMTVFGNQNTGKVYLNGGTYTSVNSTAIKYYGTLNANGTTVSSKGRLGFSGPTTLSNCTINNGIDANAGGNVTLTGATHITNTSGYSVRIYSGGTAVVDNAIIDGTFFNSSDNDATHAVITGGTFKELVEKDGHKGTPKPDCYYTVQGGTFYVNPQKYLTEDYAIHNSTDENDVPVYVVVPSVAAVNGVGYETFAEAAEARTSDEDVITLKDDIEDAYTMAADGIMKVEKNEFSVTVTAPESYIISQSTAEGVTTYSCNNIGFSATLSLQDSIDIHFYVKNLPDNYADYSVTYTFMGETVTEPCNCMIQNESGNKSYHIVASCTSRQMTKPVDIVVRDPDGNVIKEVTYSVKTYCDNKLAPDSTASDKLKNLCKAVEIYGNEAQKYFGDDDCEAVISDDKYDISDLYAVPADYDMTSNGACNGIKKLSATLALDSKTELNFYITPKAGVTIDNLTFTVDGNEITTESEGSITLTELDDGRFKIAITGISPTEFNHAYTVSISDGDSSRTVSYSPLTYAYRNQNKQSYTGLCKALYNYYLTAVAYNDNSH